jgi:hypothetical protein
VGDFILDYHRGYPVNKNSKTSKGPAKSASKRKVVIKDLKAKDAGSVRGGAEGGNKKVQQ